MLKCCNLRVNRETTPMGIDESVLCFSYELLSNEKCVRQEAFILSIIEEESGKTIYTSGKEKKEQEVNITISLPNLLPKTLYRFDVGAWDNKGNYAEASSFFETGLKGDILGKWIEPVQRSVPRDEDQVKSVVLDSAEAVDENKVNLFGEKIENRDYSEFCPCLFLRKEFDVIRKVRKARIYATAHGLYRLFLNGERVGDKELTPEISSYKSILQYQTYDITNLLVEGKNAIGMILADGWWSGRVGLSGDSCQFGDKLGALSQMEIEYDNGEKQVIITDKTWKSTDKGPYIFADLFVGEKYDAGRELTGFDKAGYDDSDWTTVVEANYGTENIKGQYGPSIAVIKEFTPKSIIVTPQGDTVIDLGQNIAGYVEMRVSGKRGTEVSLEHSEVLDEKGNFINNISGKNKDQKDIYILKGEGIETYRPAFTYHGFRYVKVEGYTGKLKVENFKACVISSDMDDIGEFSCSDERLNRLQQNIWWSQVANTISIPTDCPQREKAGWGGDISIYAPTASYLRNTDAFLRTWLDNVRAEQFDDGQIPMVIPYLKAYLHIKELVGSHSSTGWGDCIINVPYALYMAYGDKFALRQNYDAMKKWVAYEQKKAETEVPEGLQFLTDQQRERQRYLLNTGFHFGDWLIPSMSITDDGEAMGMFRSAFLTKELVAPAFYAYSTGMMAKIAGILEEEEDQRYYSVLHGKIKDAYAKEYIGEDGFLSSDFQGVYVIALMFGLYPEHLKKKGAKRLAQLIEQNDYKLDTGFLSVPYLLDVLCDNGYTDLAYKILYQEECPSWLYEVKNGATTMWEAWQAIMPDGKVTNLSYNHFAFGCVGDFIYRRVCGLRAEEPGYRKVIIEPGTESGLSFAKTSYHSPYGRIEVEWRRDGEYVDLDFELPVGVSAKVIPNHDSDSAKYYGSGRTNIRYKLENI